MLAGLEAQCSGEDKSARPTGRGLIHRGPNDQLGTRLITKGSMPTATHKSAIGSTGHRKPAFNAHRGQIHNKRIALGYTALLVGMKGRHSLKCMFILQVE